MFYRAKLDHHGIYWGVEAAEFLADGDIEVPVDCDLRPGAYRLAPPDAEHPQARFMPIEPTRVSAVPTKITSDEAFYALTLAMHQALPTSVPKIVIEWAAQFEKSWDMDNGRRSHYFREQLDGRKI